MILTFAPQVGLPGQPETRLVVEADALTVDDIRYDLSGIPEGGEACPQGTHPFVGTIARQDGVIRCTVRVILGDDTDPVQPGDPDHWTVTCPKGAVTLPVKRTAGVRA